MAINFGSKNKNILIQNLNHQITLIKDLTCERTPIPKELYELSPFFANQQQFNFLVLNSLGRIEEIFNELTKEDYNERHNS